MSMEDDWTYVGEVHDGTISLGGGSMFIGPGKKRDRDLHPLSSPRWIKEYLNQDEKWVDASGVANDISEMDREHAMNAAIFMLRRSYSIIAVLSVESYEDAINEADLSMQYVMRTPLYHALVSRVNSEESVRPW